MIYFKKQVNFCGFYFCYPGYCLDGLRITTGTRKFSFTGVMHVGSNLDRGNFPK